MVKRAGIPATRPMIRRTMPRKAMLTAFVMRIARDSEHR
jgi:hypothetical protein